MRRVVELHWPTLLVTCVCCGLAASLLVAVSLVLAGVAILFVLGASMRMEGFGRLVALGVVLTLLGLTWGSLRMEALRASVLDARIGEAGPATLVTVAPARRSQWSTRVISDVREFRREPLDERVLLVLPAGRSPPRGAILDAAVDIEAPRTAEHGFDEHAWLERQGIHVVLHASTWREVGRRGGIAGLGDRLRDRIERAVGRGTTGVRRGIVLGVVLGEDEGLPDGVRQDFRASGLYHLLAVSGQNVAFLAAGILGIAWLLRMPRIWRELATLAVIAAYVLAVGWQPSVARAGVAGALASLAWLTARPRDRWYLLAFGALVLMAWMPTTVLDPGFQLSFAAVASIFVAVPRLRRQLDGYPLPQGIADALAVSLACGVATAPIVLFDFGKAPLYTVVANLAAFSAAPVVLGLGLLAAVVDPLSPSAATGLASLAGLAAAWLNLVARVVAGLPAAQIPPRLAAELAAGAAMLWLGIRVSGGRGARAVPFRGPVVLAACAAAVLAAAWLATRPAPAWNRPVAFRITFLDVGQGDSTLLETPGARVLVDEGPPEAHVASQLRRMGIRSLSAMVLTHPQRDHVGGAADVLRGLRVGEILDPGLAVSGSDSDAAHEAAHDRGVPIDVVRTGAVFRAGGLRIHVLWPEDAGGPAEDPNQNAVVLIASYGTTDVYLSADAESDVTAKLPLPDVDVMKVAHHGSEDLGLADELRTLRPEVAVISCGKHNDYGHPRPDTLAALHAYPGLAVYRTDENGRIVIESDGHGLAVRTQR